MTKLRTMVPVIALAAAIGGAAWAQDNGKADAPEPNPAIGEKGPDCLALQRIDRTEILDDSTILFHMKGKTTYISQLPYRCHGLKFERGFAYSTSIANICGNVDTITVLRRGNSCALGPFYEYDMAKHDAARKAEKARKTEKEAGPATE